MYAEKIKRTILIILAVVVLLGIQILPELEDADISLSLNDYARIVEMDYKAVVVDEYGGQGKILVTERITFDVHAASRYNGFWELWRDLCESEVDGAKVHYNVLSVKQIMEDGSAELWEESPRLYWDDYDYVSYNPKLGPGKWYHSEGPYDPDRRQYECVLFYVNNLYREKVTFEIQYEMYNAVLRYGDCADLYISMYSGETAKYLESFSAEILIPNQDMPQVGNYMVTTYGTRAHSFPVEESTTKNPGYYTFSFDLTQKDLKFKNYNEYIEFDLVSYGEDKHIFADHASSNWYYDDNVLDIIRAEQDDYAKIPARYKLIKAIVCAVCVALAAVVLFIGKRKLDKLNSKYPFCKQKPTTDPYRLIPSDLDPTFAAELVFCKDRKRKKKDGETYSAILLSLARKEYVELKETVMKNLEIVLNEAEPDPLLPREALTQSEQCYLDMLKRHAKKGSITMEDLQERISTDYIYTKDFVKNMKRASVNSGVAAGYITNADWLKQKSKLRTSAIAPLIIGGILLVPVNIIAYFTRLDLAFGGFFVLGAACVLIGVYWLLQAHKYAVVTEQGASEYEKWRGLYNFLKSDTLINERTVVELPLWERYLVYATAFGISEKVIEAIKLRCPEISEDNSIVHNPHLRSGRYYRTTRVFYTSVYRGYHGSYHSGGGYGGYGGGGGFSGGYGGGGRGGGGGGGGH